ncbi:MAG TPA: F0F1 ATP synthase subunit delta [Sutterella sp.]|nr:F0F1 ATP synthase subunit delta [Sutterella sp.]
MAELSTIARPYAQGLWKALEDNPNASEVQAVSEGLEAISEAVSSPEISALISDPNLTKEELFEALKQSLGREVPKELEGLLLAVIENGRIPVLGEISRQFKTLVNAASGMADVQIESAFKMTKTQVDQLVKSLGKKFPGVKLNPTVTVNPDLIGGVCIRVGDQILDESVRARLEQMRSALTA